MLQTLTLKKTFSIICLQVMFISLNAQNKLDRVAKKDFSFFAEMPVTKITLPTQPPGKGTLPFKDIMVIDGRYDTTIVGFKRAQLLAGSEKISLSSLSTGLDIQKYIRDSYKFTTTGDSGFNLVLVLEKCWLTFSLQKDSGHIGVFKQGVLIKAGLMAEKEGIHRPIYQVDTVFDNTILNAKDKETMLALAIDKVLGKIIDAQATSIKLSKHGYTLTDLQVYEKQKLNIPILTSATYVKGVYRTFEEFKNNAPSIPGYEVGHKGKTDMVFGFEKDSTPVGLKDAWGFCDGKQPYIFAGESFFPLIKSGNTFNAYGFKSFTFQDKINVLIFVDAATFNPLMLIPIPSAGTYKDIKMPLQLDMDTGLLN